MPVSQLLLMEPSEVQFTQSIPIAKPAFAAIVHSTIPVGRTPSIDTTPDGRALGVLAIFTYRNTPPMNPTPKPSK